jgi:protein RecA
MSEKLSKLKELTKSLNRKAGRDGKESSPVVFFAGDRPDLLDLGVIQTGNPALDKALDGGLPRGAIAVLAGKPGAGKSCACFDMIAFNQKTDPEFVVIYVNTESRSFPLRAALQAGVDLSRMLIIHAMESGEKTFNIALAYLWDWKERKPRDLVDLLVIDSIAAAVPQAEIDAVEKEGLEKATVGTHARMMAKFLRVVTGTGSLGRTCLLFVNQLRKDIGSYAVGDTQPGGYPVEFWMKVCLMMRAPRGDYIREGAKGAVIGHKVKGEVIKNNTGIGKPHATFEYEVYYGKGVDTFGPLLDYAVAAGIIENRSVGHYYLSVDGYPLHVKGKENMIAQLREEPALCSWVEEQIAAASTRKAEEEMPEAEATPHEEEEHE